MLAVSASRLYRQSDETVMLSYQAHIRGRVPVPAARAKKLNSFTCMVAAKYNGASLETNAHRLSTPEKVEADPLSHTPTSGVLKHLHNLIAQSAAQSLV